MSVKSNMREELLISSFLELHKPGRIFCEERKDKTMTDAIRDFFCDMPPHEQSVIVSAFINRVPVEVYSYSDLGDVETGGWREVAEGDTFNPYLCYRLKKEG